MPAIQLSTNMKTYLRGYKISSAATDTASVPTLTDPLSTDGVVLVKDANLAKLLFFGEGVDGELISDVRVYAWSRLRPGANQTFIPTLIGKYNMVIGTYAGPASGTDVDDSDLFAESITLVDGDESSRIVSGVANECASLTVDLEGAEYIQVKFLTAIGGVEVDKRNFLWSTF
jgi:hypothetical protein